MTITFLSDKVKLNGPKIDGSFSVMFETGDYAWNKIKELPNFNGKTIKVEVSLVDDAK